MQLLVPRATVKINVVDGAGNPVSGAEVDTYERVHFSEDPWHLGGSVAKSSTTTNSSGATTVTAFGDVAGVNGAGYVSIGVVPPSGYTQLSNVYIAELPLSGDSSYTMVLDGEVPATASNVVATRSINDSNGRVVSTSGELDRLLGRPDAWCPRCERQRHGTVGDNLGPRSEHDISGRRPRSERSGHRCGEFAGHGSRGRTGQPGTGGGGSLPAGLPVRWDHRAGCRCASRSTTSSLGLS